jgi:hypothetical protein
MHIHNVNNNFGTIFDEIENMLEIQTTHPLHHHQQSKSLILMHSHHRNVPTRKRNNVMAVWIPNATPKYGSVSC